MSGPFGVSMTIISAGQRSGEIVVTAATFLSMGFLTIDCVCTDTNLHPEFLTALKKFAGHPGMYSYHSPDSFVNALVEPNDTISTKGLFWLALDTEGENLAKDIFRAHGEPVDTRVYQAVHKLNLIEQPIQPPAEVPLPVEVWKREQRDEEKAYIAWFESVYEAVLPWREVIKNIQSDFS